MARPARRKPDYAAMFDGLPVACAVLSPALTLVHANRSWCELAGTRSEDLAGRPVLDVFPLKAIGQGSPLAESLQRCVRSGAPDDVTMVLDDGTQLDPQRWQVKHTPQRDPLGQVTAVLQALLPQGAREELPSQPHRPHGEGEATGARADVERLEEEQSVVRERLRASELRFRTLANRLPGVVYRRILHPDGSINDVYVSDGVEALLGVPASALMSGEASLFDFVHPEDRDRKLHAMRAASQRGEPLVIEVRKIARPDGKVRWWRVHTTPTRLPDGLVQWDAMAIDITEQKAAEQQLHHAMKLEAVGQLTGGIAHDFNNLLTIILGNAETLVEKLADQPRLRALAVLTLTAAERGSDMTNRLLTFARQQPLAPRIVDVNNLVRAMEPLLGRALGEHIELELALGGGLWKAHVDPGQFEAALLNLALNARDAMRAGGRLKIETTNIEMDEGEARLTGILSKGRFIALSVSDNGCGMSPEVMARAFEPFFTTKQFGRGSGLGLSMVFGFMKQSGGHVTIRSEQGHGTTVSLYLPESSAPAAPLVVHEGGEVVPGGSETILLVEDDAMVRDHVSQMLSGLGYKVIEAPDGPQALAIMREAGGVDLLLTDVIMPGGMTGKELVEAARHERPHLQALFMSGYTENAIHDGGQPDPRVPLLRKPFRRRELAETLRNVLDAAYASGTWYVE